MVEYTDREAVSEIKINREPTVLKYNLSQTANGYGRKLLTQYMVRYNNKWKRVYCMQYGNSGSVYILNKGQELFLDTDTEHDLMELNK